MRHNIKFIKRILFIFIRMHQFEKIYGIVSFILAVHFYQFFIAIFTSPIYARYLELEDFAIIGYFTAIQAILYPLFSMSLPFYYLAKYWRKEEGADPQENLSFILNFLNSANVLLQ